MTTENEVNANRREFSRVYAYIPMVFRRVPPDEHPVIRSRIAEDTIAADFSILPAVEDPLVAEWIKMMNGKLDIIIRLLTVQNEGFQSLPFKAVNISASGMSFSSHEPWPVGEVIEIKMILFPGQPMALYLYVYGEIAKIEQKTSGHILAVRFIKVDDKVRDAIVKFVFEREREILRGKRN